MTFSHLSVCVQCIWSTSAIHASCTSTEWCFLMQFWLAWVCGNVCTLFVFKGWDGLINISVGSVLWKQCSNSLWACVWEKRGKRYLSEMWGKGVELNLSGSTVHLSSVKCAQGSIKHTRFCLLLPLRNTGSLRFSSWNKVWYRSNSTFKPCKKNYSQNTKIKRAKSWGK